jgi:AcrR family transcriptional regulator
MAPRAYNNETRLHQQAELKHRIAAAAAQLHAVKGGLATSYAEIAQAAGVSLPTVYKHFPDLDALMGACTAHVGAQAPEFPAAQILAAADLAEAVARLVKAADRLNAFFEPWLVWREEERIPLLGQLAAGQRQQLTGFIETLLAQHGIAEAPKLAPAWEAVLHFEFWHRLVRQHKLSRQAARDIQQHLLLAVSGPRRSASPLQRPT